MKFNKNLIIALIVIVALGAAIAATWKGEEKEKPVNDRIQSLIDSMTLQDKIGQMVLIDKTAITLDDVRRKSIGGVLSGGGGNPEKIHRPNGMGW